MTDLPPGWTTATLDDIALSVKNGIFVSRPGTQPNGVPILRISAVRPGQLDPHDIRYTGLDAETVAERDGLVGAGDLLFTRYNGNIEYVGACALVTKMVGALSYPDKLIRVRVDPRVAEAAYVCHAFQAPRVRAQVRKVARTTAGQAGISGASLRQVTFPLPPIAEQRRIVAALEDHLWRMNAGHSLLDAARRKVARLRERVMQLTATGQMNGTAVEGAAPPPAPAGVVDGDLPRIPPTWRWERLGDVADVLGGVTKDSKRQSDPDFVEVPYLRVANVQRGYLDLTDVATIRVAPSKAEALALRPGDVLLNEGGDRDKLGRGWVWEGQIEGCIHQNHVFRARVHNGLLHPKLLAWHANGFGKQWFQANGRQSVNLASISLSKVRLLPVPVPPAGEQESLVKLAEQYLSILDKFEHATCAAFARVRKLRESLLAEAFAGRLVEQDPKGEQAVELLARIRAEASAKPAKKTRSPRTPKQAPAHTTSVTDDDFRQEELPL